MYKDQRLYTVSIVCMIVLHTLSFATILREEKKTKIPRVTEESGETAV